MLRIRNLVVEKSGKKICSLADCKVERGERIGVIGSNGCGKSTLLRVIAGLERTFEGELQVEARTGDCVFVHQAPYLFRGSVLFNTKYGLRSRKISNQEQTATARRWLQAFGVAHLEKRSCAALSGGEQRRVALARAFAIQPELLLLDEPLADLDSEGIELVCKAISEKTGGTILISSPIPLTDTLTERSLFVAKPS